jgi:hypothetical protein
MPFIPDPKPTSPTYKPYIDFIKKRPCAKTGRHGNSRIRQIVAAHQRQLGGGGTSLKPSDFHALPLLKQVHRVKEHGINGGYVFTKEEAAIKCLTHEIIYLGLKASPFQMVQVIDMIGAYIKENKI